MRSGRPWGSLKGKDPTLHDLARHLRGVVDGSKLTTKEIGKRCGCSDSKVSKLLGGDQLPDFKFVTALIDACTPETRQADDRKREVRPVWEHAARSHYRRPSSEPSLSQPHSEIMRAQAQTISAQQELIEVTKELGQAHKQLAESAQVQFQASQVILVLQIVLARLSTLISGLTRDRDRYRAEAAQHRGELETAQRRLDDAKHKRGRAETQLDQAEEERGRANALTEQARATIRLLEARLGGADVVPAGVESGSPMLDSVAPSLDDMLLDMAAGLDRVQQLLDAQDRELTELESVRSVGGGGTQIGDAKYRAMFTDAMTGIAIMDVSGRIIEANSALQDILGYSEAELCQHNVRDLLTGQSSEVGRYEDFVANEERQLRVDMRLHRSDGDQIWTACTFSLVRDDHGDPQYQMVMIEDITDRHLLQNRLRYQALHDPLTGLPNRMPLLDRLGRVFTSRDKHLRAGLCYLGLDGFKVINDSLGHDVGDQLLVEVGRRLDYLVIGEGEFVARMGSDEFVILVEETGDAQDVVEVADRVLRELEEPILIGEHDLSISTSIGIVERPVASSTSADFLRDASIALQRAKVDGKARWALFDQSGNGDYVARFTLAATMPHALERGEFYVEYQPVVRLEDSTVVGVEALVRWLHPEFGRLAPDKFVPLAEESGLIIPLGRWVMREACRQGRRWLTEFGAAAPYVSVNLAVRQARDTELVHDVRRILDECGLPTHRLQLEITENAIMGSAYEPLEALRTLSNMGVRIAIDDYGTGYSNVSYLKYLPVRELKISGALMEGLRASDQEDPVDAQIVATVVQLAHAMSFDVTADGVETRAQAARLRRVGCDAGQGWFFSRPVPPERIDALLLERSV